LPLESPIRIYDNSGKLEYDYFTFSGGEEHVRIKRVYSKNITMSANLRSSRHVMQMLLLNDALKRMGCSIKLRVDYVPYARQDRVCNVGEALSIKVFADLINSCGFDTVTIVDPHSDVTPALINNCEVIEQHSAVTRIRHREYSVVVAPDAGASKKAFKVAKELGVDTVVIAEKVRDVSTGHILKTHIAVGKLDKARILVVDDICDGGRTFIELAKVIYSNSNYEILDLFVTHGIFSQGVKNVKEHFDNIYTTDSIFNGKSNSVTLI
jgi:ribose-phosphate pyrophosphokinase